MPLASFPPRPGWRLLAQVSLHWPLKVYVFVYVCITVWMLEVVPAEHFGVQRSGLGKRLDHEVVDGISGFIRSGRGS